MEFAAKTPPEITPSTKPIIKIIVILSPLPFDLIITCLRFQGCKTAFSFYDVNSLVQFYYNSAEITLAILVAPSKLGCKLSNK